MHAKLAACDVSPRAVPKHGASFTPLVMLLQCMLHDRQKIPHLVFRIDIAAIGYEQLGYIRRMFHSRIHQGCAVVLRVRTRPSLTSVVMSVYSHNKRMVGVH